jgi:hypothetical protein
MSQGPSFEIRLPEPDGTPEGQQQMSLSLAGQLHDFLTSMGGSTGQDKDAFLQQLQAEMDERDRANGNPQ